MNLILPGRKALIEEENNFEKEIRQENDTLKKILGEEDLEIAILKDLLKKSNPQLLKYKTPILQEGVFIFNML